MTMTYGVGILGSGPGVVALHLPTLGHLRNEFQVVHIADGGSGRARGLAAATGARVSIGETELLADTDVDVVLVCSSPEHHSRQVRAAAAAGKRAVLCEKPLALSPNEVREVIDDCRASGTVLMVGTNHYYDPAWRQARKHLAESASGVQAVSVTVAVPPNHRYHEVVSQQADLLAAASAAAAATRPPRPDLSDPAIAAHLVGLLLTGLAVHDLPALREIAPAFERVVYARALPPVGYAVGYLASGVLVQLTGVMVPGGADVLWRMALTTTDERVEVEFPPAFVHPGGGRVRVRGGDGLRTEYTRGREDGYLTEWMALGDLLSHPTSVDYGALEADAIYVMLIANGAAEFILQEARR
ncbi:Gfo/Idh/MocA family protein [Subtercola sp. YIM 133946]|uniref:Gfo/Idh/MocA family protein n=1 Tax=Subtercola sp. YIM 133946 TaxID=3118909 RepID=UPI002F92343B